ncbi:BN159_2729 family protein [Streptomyces sp. NPDC007084]|uniref:BN159_2729 family protein n=1 Tax=Streptomyces sp. NPDC007084 TaxID=3154313 RepID=UPI00345631E6
MTTTPEHQSPAETELATLLNAAARTFVAELEAQGRLVEVGGASALKRLRTQVEARRSLPAGYRTAVDTIVDDCGYPSEVAVRIARALQRKGLLGDGDDGPDPQHDRASAPTPLAPAPRGSFVVRLPARDATHRESEPEQQVEALVPQRVNGAVPQLRPAAAHAHTPEDAEHARAVTVAATLQLANSWRSDVSEIEADGGRVTVAIKATNLSDWDHWLSEIGAPPNVPTRPAGHAQIAAGTVEGVDVHLTAHGVPELLGQACDEAREAFYMWGRVYDLGRGVLDQHGRVWVYLGQRQDDGMPLLIERGSSGPACPLGSIVMASGPLTAIDLPAHAPAEAIGGGA